MLPSEILQKAKDSLTEKTWGKGNRQERAGGTLCAAEAIGIHGVDYTYCTSFLRYAISTSSIVAWNDAPERTLAEVHAAFDKAIAAAKEAGQ